ncbi:hypothetical protein E5Q_03962 [Mixia osmundae IAM 14324]|uniref:F-box domain-containing protein n=2 Tax=Mixia osmundae (strain CBS 9802 / IAM 14324 / JCM 22182 / KY 12970) TaxID=764103 RepID=G7E2U0_MIXOS|nr:hypothetical protein E5Q_03962 [Mixia osmundae IAM 14324]
MTGGATGVGARAIRALVSQGIKAKIHFTYNRSSPDALLFCETDETSLHAHQLDLAQLTSVRSWASALQRDLASIDVLVLNAAIINQQRKQGILGYVEEVLVNHLSQHYLIQLLRPLLSKGSRIVFVGSELHRKALNQDLNEQVRFDSTVAHDSTASYATTKALLMLSAQYWHRTLAADGIQVCAVSPGFVPSTGLSRNASWPARVAMKWLIHYAPFAKTEEQGGALIARAMTAPLPASQKLVYFQHTGTERGLDERTEDRVLQEKWRLSKIAPAVLDKPLSTSHQFDAHAHTAVRMVSMGPSTVHFLPAGQDNSPSDYHGGANPSQAKPLAGLLSLPNELLFDIAQRVGQDSVSDVISLSKINKKLCSIVDEHLCRTVIGERKSTDRGNTALQIAHHRAKYSCVGCHKHSACIKHVAIDPAHPEEGRLPICCWCYDSAVSPLRNQCHPVRPNNETEKRAAAWRKQMELRRGYPRLFGASWLPIDQLPPWTTHEFINMVVAFIHPECMTYKTMQSYECQFA